MVDKEPVGSDSAPLQPDEAERKLRSLEHELREHAIERRQFAAITNDAGAGFVVVDRAHRVIWANSVFRERFQTNPMEMAKILGRDCNRLLCGKPEICANCPVSRSFESGEAAHHELRLWLRDSYHSVYVIGTPIRSPGGEIEQVMLMLVDVTGLEALRRSDEAFLLSEQRFRSVFDGAPAGMATIRPDGSIMQANPALCAMLGYTQSDLQKKKLAQLLHPDDRGGGPDRKQESRFGKLRTEQIERRFIRRDGSELWGQTTYVTELNDEERPVHTIVMVHDVTERKNAERALVRTQADHGSLIDSIDGVVWQADPQTMRFRFVSRQAESILGFSRDRWLGQPRFWRNRIHPEDLDGVVQAIARSTDDGEGFELEYRMIAADGRTVWVRDRVSVVRGPDDAITIRGVMTDITEHRLASDALERSREQLLQTQRMKAIGRLAGGLAGDLDKLLESIQSNSDDLLSDSEPDRPPREKVEQISRAARCAAELTGQLRAFSLRQSLHSKELHLDEAISDMEGLIRHVIDDKTVLVTAPGSSTGRVSIDPGRLQQVVLNLVVQTQDAMPDGGRLELLTEDLEVGTQRFSSRPTVEPGRYVRLIVGDAEPNAPAMDPRAGLGLSAVQGIVERCGGRLHAFGEAGRVRRVEVWLPRMDEPNGAEARADEADGSGAGQAADTILEKQILLRDLAREILEASAPVAATAADEETAMPAGRIDEERTR